MTDTPSETTQNDYSQTLFLPKTDFPMRAGLPKREPEWIERWNKIDLYKALREKSEGREKYVLHDGPPYANGHLHIGHALNKILKDMVTRSMQMMGYDANYVPGWDCHGLPIEWKIEEQYRAKGKDKEQVPVNEFREECRIFAKKWIDVQREEFKRMGVIGDWDHPYKTMTFEAEAKIAEELIKFSMTDQLYRGSKPVMWSVVEKTALAEAEIEYEEHQSDMIWVLFPINPATIPAELEEDLKDTSIVIWTTTPWTIPGNRAITYSNEISYGIYKVTEAADDNWAKKGLKVLLADNLAQEVMEKARVDEFERLGSIKAEQLSHLTCHHPFFGHGYEFDVPLFQGDFVTDDTGTGLVHTAPSHGPDDFEVWINNRAVLLDKGIDPAIPHTVDADGFYTSDAPCFEGKSIITSKGKTGDANQAVITKLAEVGRIIARGKLKHPYPHSWRSKKPVIFRNTPQWFITMGDEAGGSQLRQKALKAIDETRFIPASGQTRLHSMIKDRPDWVISRQRAWGVPITVFVNKESGEVLKDETVNTRIIETFKDKGADAWFEDGAAAHFLGDNYRADDWEQVTDILDVWFDSGSTHSFVLEMRPDLKWPADLYLEGSDQHRGWFHSSLLESCGTRGRAPYDAVLTHGFTLDEQGRKMSKSLGNTTLPQDVINQSGADILRLWVASSDYSEDQRIGPEIIKTHIDSYRKMRNTLRWLLGSLHHFEDAGKVSFDQMPELERYILHRLAELDQTVRKEYKAYNYKAVITALFNFMSFDLSAFYFDIRKDALYCDPISSQTRLASLTVLDHIFNSLTLWLAPLLSFTMEEAWLARDPEREGSIHLLDFPEIPVQWQDEVLGEKWKTIRTVRRVITGALEIERQNKVIGSSLDAAPDVYIDNDDLYQVIETIDIAELAITSDANLHKGTGPNEAFTLDDVKDVKVVIKTAEGQKCARSWKITADIGADADWPDISLRDAKAMRELEASQR